MKRSQRGTRLWLMGAMCVGLMAHSQANASLARNAAGARNIGEAGKLALDTAGEFASEEDGNTSTIETSLQYQVSNRLQALIEATLFERFAPDAEESVSGFGDTDVTLSWLVSEGDNKAFPSVVAGAKVKLPTGGEEIGTGKADYSALLVFAKESGELELSLEAEYATFGSSAEEELKNQLIYTFTVEYGLTGFLAVYAEVFGNNAPTVAESRTDAALLGVEIDYQLSKLAAPYLSLEMDTEGVGTARAGVEWTW